MLQTSPRESILQRETQTCDWNCTFNLHWHVCCSHTLPDVKEITPALAVFAEYQTVLPPAVNDFFSFLCRKPSWARRSEADSGKWSSPSPLHSLLEQSEINSSVILTKVVYSQLGLLIFPDSVSGFCVE